MELLLVLELVITNCCELKRYGLFNVVNITMAPYVIIVVLNNFIATRWGYYRIENRVQVVIAISIIIIFLAARLRDKVKFAYGVDGQKNNEISFVNNKNLMKKVRLFFSFCCIIRGYQIFNTVIRYGIVLLGRNDFYELGFSGLQSHLFLAAYPVAAFLFLDFLENRKKLSLILYLVGLLLSIGSFIKYHAIIYILFTFVFCVLYDRKFIRRLSLITLGLIISVFIGNYIFSFWLRNITLYTSKDYFIKLWDYLSGSVINGNNCINFFKPCEYSAKELIAASILAVPKGIINKIFNTKIVLNAIPLGFMSISAYGSKSNVASMIFNISYTGSVGAWLCFLFFQGWVVQGALKRVRTEKKSTSLVGYSMFLSINILLFFANYFVLSTIWELMIWSFLIPKIIQKYQVRIRTAK